MGMLAVGAHLIPFPTPIHSPPTLISHPSPIPTLNLVHFDRKFWPRLQKFQ